MFKRLFTILILAFQVVFLGAQMVYTDPAIAVIGKTIKIYFNTSLVTTDVAFKNYSGDVYAQNMNITGTGAVMLDGDLNGALGYGADGTVVLGNNAMITGTVTNDTLTDGMGGLTLASSAALE